MIFYHQASNDPQFLKTIGFGDKEGVDTNMRVKITVYHVKERLTGTVSTFQCLLQIPRRFMKINGGGSSWFESTPLSSFMINPKLRKCYGSFCSDCPFQNSFL
jgi:hypothetical protein